MIYENEAEEFEKELNCDFKIIEFYENEDDVIKRDLRLGNGEMLSDAIKDPIDELFFPFYVIRYEDEFWVLNDDVNLNIYSTINAKTQVLKIMKKMGWLVDKLEIKI